jgi:hypothetical protein
MNDKHYILGIARLGLISLFIFSLSELSFAATVQANFEINYKSGLFTKKPNKKTREKILPMAREALWKSFKAKQETATLRALEKNKEKVNERLSDLISNIEFVDERVLKDERVLRYVVRGVVNENQLNVLLVDSKSGGNIGVVALILPRAVASEKAFDQTIKKDVSAVRESKSKSIDASNVEESDTSIIEKNLESSKEKVSAGLESSGSQVNQSNERVWKLADSAQTVDSEIQRYFTEANFQVVNYSDVAAECGSKPMEDVQAVFISSPTGQPSSAIFKEMKSASKKCRKVVAEEMDLRYLAVGTMDVDSVLRDENSGGYRANVLVNIKVYDVSKILASTVASVGNQMNYGVDSTEKSAVDRALGRSADEAVRLIISQLQQK